jgi:peptidylprolyl isomerase
LAVLAVLASALAAETPKITEPPADAERTASGLVSVVLDPGFGDTRPDHNDFVEIHYTAYTSAGAQFESSYDAGQPARFFVEQSFPAWREGIPLMVAGEKRRFWAPEALKPQGGQMPRGTVVFDIELTGIVAIPEPPEALIQAPPDAERTIFGAFTKTLSKPEDGASYADTGGAMTVYTLWNGEGRILESSLARGRPTLFPMDKVMPAFADILKKMVEGEKRYVWIPESVHNGQWPRGPKGMLVFELQVVQFVDTSFMKPGR